MTAVLESEPADLPRTQNGRYRWSAMIAVVAVLIVAVACLSLFRGQGNEAAPGPLYSSAQEMADAAGCTDTFRSASASSTSSAGSCTVDGVKVDLIIYPTRAETSAWLDAIVYSASPDRVAGVHGYTWGAAVHTQDRAVANRIFMALGG